MIFNVMPKNKSIFHFRVFTNRLLRSITNSRKTYFAIRAKLQKLKLQTFLIYVHAVASKNIEKP